MTTVHRASLNGGALCHAANPRLSVSGVTVTCPDCLRLSTPLTPEEAMTKLKQAALLGTISRRTD